MNIVVMSLWRNSSYNIAHYMNRIDELKAALPRHTVRVLAVEGDSTDDTAERLGAVADYFGVDLQLVQHHHGGPVFGSTEAPERMRALSGVFNAGLAAVRGGDDLFLYVEQDLQWRTSDLTAILNDAARQRDGIDVVGPMVMAAQAFYDIWAFRTLQGDRFSPFVPFASGLELARETDHLFEVSAFGSCLAMRAEVAHRVRIRDGNAIVGWCAEARALGYRLGVNTRATVRQL